MEHLLINLFIFKLISNIMFALKMLQKCSVLTEPAGTIISIWHFLTVTATVSILSSFMQNESHWNHLWKLKVLRWMTESVFPMNKLVRKGGGEVLILCSFLRLIIHSTASSCYWRSALHPCSSRLRLTLKNLMVIWPKDKKTLKTFFHRRKLKGLGPWSHVFHHFIWLCIIPMLKH